MKSQSQKLSEKSVDSKSRNLLHPILDMRSEIEMPSCSHFSVERVRLNQNQNKSCASNSSYVSNRDFI